jgi:hypothetical protein
MYCYNKLRPPYLPHGVPSAIGGSFGREVNLHWLPRSHEGSFLSIPSCVVVAHPPPNPVFAEDRYRKKTVKTGLSPKDLIIAVFKWG